MVLGLESVIITRLWFRVQYETRAIQSLLNKDGIIASDRSRSQLKLQRKRGFALTREQAWISF